LSFIYALKKQLGCSIVEVGRNTRPLEAILEAALFCMYGANIVPALANASPSGETGRSHYERR